jgi:hypothetical protein
VAATIAGDLRLAGWGPWSIIPSLPTLSVEVTGEAGSVKLSNFVQSAITHAITVSKKGEADRVETLHEQGKEHWTSCVDPFYFHIQSAVRDSDPLYS